MCVVCVCAVCCYSDVVCCVCRCVCVLRYVMLYVGLRSMWREVGGMLFVLWLIACRLVGGVWDVRCVVCHVWCDMPCAL